MADWDSDLIELNSAWDFEDTTARVIAAIETAGLTLLARIDHAQGARDVGLVMPPTTVLIYGNPRAGTPIMVACPVAALDLPLRVLIREKPDGRAAIAFHPSGAMLRRAGVPDDLAECLLPAQRLVAKAIEP